jgi:hypothetical protein
MMVGPASCVISGTAPGVLLRVVQRRDLFVRIRFLLAVEYIVFIIAGACITL